MKIVRGEKGFTLVELAIVLVIIGIILGAVLKGQELMNNAKAKRIQNDMQGFEAMIWTYYDRKGRYPGDCNGDGVYAYNPPNLTIGTATPPSNNATPTGDYCALSTTTEGINTPFSDLRVSRVAPQGTPNVTLARHQYNDFYKIGTTTTGVNIIVVYGVPAWLAKMIDVSIDGTESGTAGRLRNYSTAPAGSAWPADTANDQIVSIAYFFEKTP